MSTRLYYEDSYLTAFDTSVLECVRTDGRNAVVLAESAFYPTSGGQPFDTGTLGDARVIDVIDLEDGRVAHVIEGALEAGATVHGAIDWPRRFDHMQQHTGQHVLSAAFEHVHGARTESFHLGTEVSTIDLAVTVTPEQVAAAEDEANRIVWENRPVVIRYASAAEAQSLPLRKESARSGTLRLVQIEGFDLSACGGTHVARTGAVGLIAVTGSERFKGGTRLEFVCGGRALARVRALRAVVSASVRHLSVLPGELPGAIERLQTEARSQRSTLRDMQERLSGYVAAELSTGAEVTRIGRVVVRRLDDLDATGLKTLAQAIVARPGHAACLFGGGPAAPVVVARAADVPIDAGVTVRALTARFGGKGGGRPELAQGGGLTGDPAAMLDAARELLG